LTTAIFSVFAVYIFRNLEIRPALLYSDTESFVGLPLISKLLTLNDLE